MENNKKQNTVIASESEAIHLGNAERWIATSPSAPRNDVVKKVATFAVYLLIALPANMAMAADWQTPAQVAALSSPVSPQQATSITITTAPIEESRYFNVTYKDVAAEVESQLVSQGVEKKARATVNPANSPILFAADHPLKLTLHALQIDPNTRQWQAQAYVIAGSSTEAVKPVSGHYEGVVSVPVLKSQMRSSDVIAADDLDTRDLLSRQLRKDTVTDAAQLIGQSPRGTISADRPIRTSEITAPIVIKKGDMVDVSYTTPYVHIKTTGIALENGGLGQALRIKNEKSEKAITARATGAGTAEVNTEQGS